MSTNERPWENEPNYLEFIEEETGFTCLIKRHPILKALCGYVIIPDELTPLFLNEKEKIKEFDVHGGINFCKRMELSKLPGEKGNIYNIVGFDCAHLDDLVPGMEEEVLKPNHISQYPGTYKDIKFVEAECRKLAKQVHAILHERIRIMQLINYELTENLKKKSLEYEKELNDFLEEFKKNKEERNFIKINIPFGCCVYNVSTKTMKGIINRIQNYSEDDKELIMYHLVFNESLDKYDG